MFFLIEPGLRFFPYGNHGSDLGFCEIWDGSRPLGGVVSVLRLLSDHSVVPKTRGNSLTTPETVLLTHIPLG